MEYIKSIDKIPDYLKCPICLEVPRNRAFQCIEGHPICEECYPKVDSCPQCRATFGSKTNRARIIERMLDELKLECKYKAQGCTKGCDRKNLKTLPEHEEHCHFNTDTFGPLITVCKNIGLENCTFQMNGGNGVEAVHHFESVHQASTSASDTLAIEFPNFFTSSGVGPKPIILNMREAGYAFLIMFGRDSSSSRFLNWAPFYIRYQSTGENKHSLKTPEMLSTSCQVKCSILGENTLTLAVKPLDILNPGWRNLSALWQRNYMMAEPESDESSGSLFAKVKVRKLFKPTGNDDNSSFTTIDLIQTCQNCLVKHDLVNSTCAVCETVNPNYIKRVGGEGATDSPQLEDSASEDDELANSLPSPLTGFGDADGKGNPTTGTTNIDPINSPGTSFESNSSRPDSNTCPLDFEDSEMSPQPFSTTVRYIDTIRIEDVTSGSSTYNSSDTAARFRLENMKRPINRIQKGRNISKIQPEKMRESSS